MRDAVRHQHHNESIIQPLAQCVLIIINYPIYGNTKATTLPLKKSHIVPSGATTLFVLIRLPRPAGGIKTQLTQLFSASRTYECTRLVGPCSCSRTRGGKDILRMLLLRVMMMPLNRPVAAPSRRSKLVIDGNWHNPCGNVAVSLLRKVTLKSHRPRPTPH